MASRSRSMSLATSPESAPLSTNRVAVPFASKSRDFFSISPNALRKPSAMVGGAGNRRAYLNNSERRSFSAWSPSLIAAFTVCLNLLRYGIRSSTFSLTSSDSCGRSCKLCHSHPLNSYLVMFDECVHAAKNRLERRTPIGRLFRDIKEDLYAIRDSMPVCWEPPGR